MTQQCAQAFGADPFGAGLADVGPGGAGTVQTMAAGATVEVHVARLVELRRRQRHGGARIQRAETVLQPQEGQNILDLGRREIELRHHIAPGGVQTHGAGVVSVNHALGVGDELAREIVAAAVLEVWAEMVAAAMHVTTAAHVLEDDLAIGGTGGSLVYVYEIHRNDGGIAETGRIGDPDGQTEFGDGFKIQRRGVGHRQCAGARINGEGAAGVAGGDGITQGIAIRVGGDHRADHGAVGAVLVDAEALVIDDRRAVFARAFGGEGIISHRGYEQAQGQQIDGNFLQNSRLSGQLSRKAPND